MTTMLKTKNNKNFSNKEFWEVNMLGVFYENKIKKNLTHNSHLFAHVAMRTYVCDNNCCLDEV